MIPNGNDYKIFYVKEMIKSYISDVYDIYIVFLFARYCGGVTKRYKVIAHSSKRRKNKTTQDEKHAFVAFPACLFVCLLVCFCNFLPGTLRLRYHDKELCTSFAVSVESNLPWPSTSLRPFSSNYPEP